MSGRPTFVDGEVHTWRQIRKYTFSAHGRGGRDAIDPNTRFVCRRPKGALYATFDELRPESEFGLVSAAEVAEAIEALRARGLDAQAIARAAGISTDSAHRAVAGSGVIRRSTRDAILAAANRKRAVR